MNRPAITLALRKLTDRLAQSRAITDQLFEIIHPTSFYTRPISERHRIVFYLGHLEAFDWNLLGGQYFGLRSILQEFDNLFAFGIDPVDGSLPADQISDWPAVAKIERYNCRIRHDLDHVLAKATLHSEGSHRKGQSLETLLNVAIEHRLMHAETLGYMLHQLPFDCKRTKGKDISLEANCPASPYAVTIPDGIAVLGLCREPSGTFGWDNEFDQHKVNVPAFEIDAYSVTNGNFLAFIREGGYYERSFWSDAGWEWITSQSIAHPKFWVRVGDAWFYRTMFADIPLPADWPVYVSHAEASAYARWAGKLLPTEAQWQRAAYGTAKGPDREYPWGDLPPSEGLGNFNFLQWDPVPINAHPKAQSAFGVYGLLGNGWEWTSTVFGPYPGFRSFDFYPGYSANFFDGKHYVLKGGSSRTAACMLRRSFRNWFQPHYPYLYATFRCVSR